MKKMTYIGIMLATVTIAGCGKRPGADNATAPPAAATATAATPASSASSAQTQPSAPASLYEGKIVRRPPTDGSKEDGWFLVENGKRRWIMNSSWLTANGRSPADVIVISAAELAKIPEDPRALQ